MISQINNSYKRIRHCYTQLESDSWSKRGFLYALEERSVSGTPARRRFVADKRR